MRTTAILLVFAICAGIGCGIGYYRFEKEKAPLTESFGNPRVTTASYASSTSQQLEPLTEPAKIEVVDGPVFDFGVMQKGTSRNHKFIVKNVGTTPAELELVRTSCKCTLGNLGNSKDGKSRRLFPGEETEIELTWTAESVLKEFGQTATIRVLPQREEFQLTVKGFVAESLEFEPSQILLGDFSPKETIKRSAKLFSNYSAPLVIEELRWREEHTADRVRLAYSVRKLEKGEDPAHLDAKYVADIDIEILPGMPTGKLFGAVVVKTGFTAEQVGNAGRADKENISASEHVMLSLSVDGNVVSDIRFFGGKNYNDESNVYTVGTVDSRVGKDDFGVSIIFRGSDLGKVELSVAEVKPAGAIEVSIQEPEVRENGQLQTFRIRMKIPPGAEPVDLPGTNSQNYAKILFRSNLSYAPEIPLFLRLQIK